MKIIGKIFNVLLVLSFCLFMYLLNDLGLMGKKIVLVLLGVILLILVSTILLSSLSKKKGLRITGYVINSIFFILFISIYFIVNGAFNIVNKFNKDSYENYYLLALKGSDINEKTDLNNMKIGTIKELSNEVKNELKFKYKDVFYEDVEEMLVDFYNQDTSLILLNDTDIYLLSEKYEELEKDVIIIKTIKIKKEEVKDKVKRDKDDPLIVYLSGIDTTGRISNVSRSDVNIIATINPNTYEVLLNTIPRDYYVQLHGTSGRKDKLTHAGVYGIDMSINTIEDLLNIDIDYYVRVNFDTVVKLVDIIGGIDIYSDQALRFCNIKEGMNHLDGKCALQFARERYSYETGDRHRGENQEEVIRAIISKVQSSPDILMKYNEILNSLSNNIDTNIDDKVLKDLVKIQMKKNPRWNVNTYNLNGKDYHDFTYSMPSQKLYVMVPNMVTVNNANKLINGIHDGKLFKDIEIEKEELEEN